MTTTPVRLFDAAMRAKQLRESGDHAAALRLYTEILVRFPDNERTRIDVADALLESGKREQAQAVLAFTVDHLVHTGRPLLAIVAHQRLARLTGVGGDSGRLVAATYCAGSERIAKVAARPIPMDPTSDFGELPALPGDDLEDAAQSAAKRAMSLESAPRHPNHLHAIPFLSELDQPSFEAVLGSIRVVEPAPGQALTRQGEQGNALYLVAWGRLRVTANIQGQERDLARLHENTLFGEMAIVSDQPRAANVVAAESAIVLEIDREALAAATEKSSTVAEALDRFARQRLIRNILATSPLFTPFSKDQQAELLRRFEGIDVQTGATVIKQGQPGEGLYVVVSGELQAAAQPDVDDGDEVVLGSLATGDIFGEMSLLLDGPTTATVRATRPSTLLFLAKSYVQRLSAAIPEVEAYFATVAESRSADNRLHLDRAAFPEEIVDLSDSDPIWV